MEAIEKVPFESVSLHPVRRGDALFYCFLEARRSLFSMFSDEYLNNLVRCLGIEIFICSDQETSFIRKFLPSEIGPFWLLREGNLLRLGEMLLDSGQIARKRQRPAPSFENQFSPFAASNCFSRSQFMPWPYQGISAEPRALDSVSSFSNEEGTSSNLGQSVSVDLLFDILESKRGYLSFADDLVAVVRLCGYLLIKTNVIHAFLVNLLSLDEVRTVFRSLPTNCIGMGSSRPASTFHDVLTIRTFKTQTSQLPSIQKLCENLYLSIRAGKIL